MRMHEDEAEDEEKEDSDYYDYYRIVVIIIVAILIMINIIFYQLKGHCIEFKYYADGIHSGLTPPGDNS